MTKTQLDNLIKFSIIFKANNYQHQSPDYIKEKWDYYINAPIPTDIAISGNVAKWKEFWGADNSLLPIIKFLESNCAVSFIKDTPSDILERFGNIFDVNSINNQNCDNLHANLDKAVDMWVNSNLRDYNLCLLA